MPRLSTGLIFAAGYADKVRRTLYAQLREYVKKDKEWGRRIAFFAGMLNRALFTLLTEGLKLDKLDVVRIVIEYDIDEANRSINWKWDTLRVDAFKRLPSEKVNEVIAAFVVKAPELSMGAVKYTVERLGETFDGDVVYSVKMDEREAGIAIVLPVDEAMAVLKKAAVLDPTPAIFEKTKLVLVDKTLENALSEELGKLMEKGIHVEYNEALKVINAIRERIKAAPMEKPLELEE
ncbi:MAG: DUF2258 domain-containing protein [Desulfurococcaceae archaeon]